MPNSKIEIILRQTADSESFRWTVERRHLLEAADEIEYLRGRIKEMEQQAVAAADPTGEA